MTDKVLPNPAGIALGVLLLGAALGVLLLGAALGVLLRRLLSQPSG